MITTETAVMMKIVLLTTVMILMMTMMPKPFDYKCVKFVLKAANVQH